METRFLIGYVDRAEQQYDSFIEVCRAFAASSGNDALALLIRAPGCNTPDSERVTTLTDTAGEFAATYHAIGGAAWIVRPDGHIGWRAGNGSAAAVEGWLKPMRGEPA